LLIKGPVIAAQSQHPAHPQSGRPLYPVPVLASGIDESAEVVRFGGYPFVRTPTGGWCVVDPAIVAHADDD